MDLDERISFLGEWRQVESDPTRPRSSSRSRPTVGSDTRLKPQDALLREELCGAFFSVHARVGEPMMNI
jgi:hypothetical protein